MMGDHRGKSGDSRAYLHDGHSGTIPIGRVVNVMQGVGTEGLALEVELNADLDHLTFLTVILYQPATELVTN